ncbi:MAG: hypothetical protein FGM37_01125 [Phycisphaerales bacterium]|nr:hypothetical protein [Phycisphaerales bacterium]
MPDPEPPLAALQRQLDSGQFEAAVSTADALMAKSRRNPAAWLARARANLSLGRIMDADRDVDECLRLARLEPQAGLMRAQIDQRLGRIDASVDRLQRLLSAPGALAVEAGVVLSEVLHFAHRHEELAALLSARGAWTADPRAALAAARVTARTQPGAAIDALRKIAVPSSGTVLYRIAGFDLVQLLDRAGDFRGAFAVATALHASTTPPYDLIGLEQAVQEQRALLERESSRPTPRAEPVHGVAIIVGLPRSGTTLLEQMLDRHPSIGGIGEYEGIERLGETLVSRGLWPRSLRMIRPDAAAQIQVVYTGALSRLRRPGREWTLDKTLSAWLWLPAIACLLPGARCLHIERDPRDCAISMFLSHFNPNWYGWMSTLASIRRVVEAYRSLVHEALSSLGIPHESVQYEALVEDPASHAARCLNRLSLPMDPAVLAPEANTRAVYTLSHEQVRRPINPGSIGRWRNYSWAFGPEWD